MHVGRTVLSLLLVATVLLSTTACREDVQHLLAQARIALDNGRPDLAFEEAKKVLQQDAANMDALLIRGEAQMQMEQFDPAMRTFERVQAHEPDRPELRALLSEWSVRRMSHLLRERIPERSSAHETFEAALTFGEKQAAWHEQHSDIAAAAYLRAQLAELDARRLYALANDPRSLLRADADRENDTVDPEELAEPPRQHSRSMELFDQAHGPAKEQFIAQAEARIVEAVQHLERAFATDPRHADAAAMYVRLLVQQRQWDTIWQTAERLAEEAALPADLIDTVLVALITIPDDARERAALKQLGTTLRERVIPSQRDTAPHHLAGARLMLLDGEWERAQTVLRRAAAQQPGHRDTAYLLALCAYQLKQFDEAEKHLTWLSNAMPESVNVQSLYGRTLLAKGDFASARRPLRMAMQLDPGNPDTRYAYMQTLVRLGQITDAEPYIQELYNRTPDDAQVLALKLQLERTRGNRSAVARVLQQVEALQPHDAAHLTMLVEGYRFLHRYDKVEAFARALSEQQPETFEVRLALAEAMLAQDKRDEAGELLQQLAAAQPNHVGVNYLLGRWELSRGSYDTAAASLQTVVQAQPRQHQARLLLAHALIGLNDVNGALVQIEEAVRLAPHNIAARDMAIRVYHLLGRHEQVAHHLQQVQPRQLNEQEWPLLLALTRMADDRLNDAAGICERSIAAGNNDPLMNLLLSAIHERREQLDQAAAHMNAFLSRQPHSAQAYQTWTAFYVRHNRASQALAYLDETRTANTALATLARANLHTAMGDPQQAITLLNDDLDNLIAQRSGLAVLAARTIADAQLQLGDAPAALATLDKLIAADTLADEATLLQIDLLMEQGETDAAHAKLHALAERLDPDKQALALEVIKRLTRAQQHERALQLVDRWLAREPNHTAMMTWRAELLSSMNRLDDAATAYRAIIAIDTRSVASRQALADIQLRQHDYPAAEATLIRMGELGYEGQIASLTGLGQLYLTVGLRRMARETLDRLEPLAAPRDGAALLQLAQGWLALEEPQRAYDKLRHINRAAPQYAAAQTMMAQIDLAAERGEEAGARLRQLAEDPVTAPVVIQWLLTLAPDNPRHHDLLRWFDEWVTLDDLPPTMRRQWLTMRLAMQVQRQDWSAALQAGEALQPLMDDATPLNEVLLLLHLARNDRDAAQQRYDADAKFARLPGGPLLAALVDRPIDRNATPSTPLLRYIIAMMRHDTAAARQAAQTLQPHRTIFQRDLLDALQSAPTASSTSAEAHRHVALAMLAADAGLITLAKHSCQRAVDVDPHAVVAFSLLAQLADELPDHNALPVGLRLYEEARQHQRNGDMTASLAAIERLAQREPDNLFVRYYLGQAYERAGDFNRAIDTFATIYQHDSMMRTIVGNDLAYLLAEHRPQRLDEAYRIAMQVRDAMETDDAANAFVLDTLGWIEHKRGNNAAALKLLQQAIPHLRDHPDAHLHIAAVYRQRNQNAWAQYHEREAVLRSQPDEPLMNADRR